MSAIEVLTLSASGVFLAFVALVGIVTAGIHHEERAATFLHADAPTLAALVARWVLGRYVRKPAPGPCTRSDPERRAPTYEHSL